MTTHQLNSTDWQANGLGLSNEAARFFWALAFRAGIYGPDPEFADVDADFMFEAGFYDPHGATRPVDDKYITVAS